MYADTIFLLQALIKHRCFHNKTSYWYYCSNIEDYKYTNYYEINGKYNIANTALTKQQFRWSVQITLFLNENLLFNIVLRKSERKFVSLQNYFIFFFKNFSEKILYQGQLVLHGFKGLGIDWSQGRIQREGGCSVPSPPKTSKFTFLRYTSVQILTISCTYPLPNGKKPYWVHINSLSGRTLHDTSDHQKRFRGEAIQLRNSSEISVLEDFVSMYVCL